MSIVAGNFLIDSRDVIDRITELEALIDNGVIDNDDADELEVLLELANDCEGIPDWEHGATLISRDYWVDYCQDMLVDAGYIPKDLPNWIEIDWQKTADNIEWDYTTVTFDSVEYLVRNV